MNTPIKPPLKPRRPVRELPAPPSHLHAPESQLWIEVVASFAFADPASLAILAAAIEARGRMRRCREAIDRDGETVVDRFQQVKSHPLLSAERDARAAFLAGMRTLNLDLGS